MGAPSQRDIRTIENAIEANATINAATDDRLSWWDRVKIAVVPQSHAESIVNEIYGTSMPRTLRADPAYDPDDLSSPNVWVQAKGAVKDATSALTSFGSKALIIAAIFILIVVTIYAVIPALVRR